MIIEQKHPHFGVDLDLEKKVILNFIIQKP